MLHRKIVWLALAALLFAGCVGQPERLWLRSPGWSRAQLVGQTRVPDPVPVVLDDAGNIYILSFVTFEDGSSPRVIALDRGANTIWEHTYKEISHRGPRQPRILWDGQLLRLFWIARGDLHRASVDAAGNLVSYQIPELGFSVDAIDVAIDRPGVASVALAGPSGEPGFHLLNLNGTTTLVDPEGVQPDIQYDQEGILHATWSRRTSEPGDVPLLYGAFPGGLITPESIRSVATPRLVGTASFVGPTLGLDNENAYVFWSTTFYSGPNAGTIESKYAHFPKGAALSDSKEQPLLVPYGFTLPYKALEGTLVSGPRVDLSSANDLGGADITQSYPNTVASDELVVAVLARLGYPMRKTKPQVAAVYFSEGDANTYQQLSFTPTGSTSPTIMSDTQGHLYLTWLERGDAAGWGIYFSSTAADLKEALRGVNLGDMASVTAETVFGLLSGALLVPISLAWAAPALVVLALTSRFWRSEDNLIGGGAFAGLALALLVLWGIKLSLLPGIQDYVPFTAWVPIIPDWLHDPLRIGCSRSHRRTQHGSSLALSGRQGRGFTLQIHRDLRSRRWSTYDGYLRPVHLWRGLIWVQWEICHLGIAKGKIS